ncbi:hypothetical protein RLOatenuis_7930 [Rickettsiales bacterium]|nr:hypothetical protein RLOatenuis_7930 [Rickettsiales bacterium]
MSQNCGYYDISSLSRTKFLANFFAGLVREQDVIALFGDLGVGKTTFVRFFINAFCGSNFTVLSPSFSLLQNYGTIWHFDLYRLKNINDVYELGIEDALNKGITIIEWPQIIMPALPKSYTVLIEIEMLKTSRLARIKYDSRWHAKDKLESALSAK